MGTPAGFHLLPNSSPVREAPCSTWLLSLKKYVLSRAPLLVFNLLPNNSGVLEPAVEHASESCSDPSPHTECLFTLEVLLDLDPL